MGTKLATQVSTKMLVIGGCELALEKNPYNSIEVITFEEGKVKVGEFQNDFPLAVRSPMAFHDSSKLFIFGGCRGYRDHIAQVQIYDFT